MKSFDKKVASSSSRSLSPLSVGLFLPFFPPPPCSFSWSFFRGKMQPCSGSLERNSIPLRGNAYIERAVLDPSGSYVQILRGAFSANVLRRNNKASLQPRLTRATIDSLACALSIVKGCQDLLSQLFPFQAVIIQCKTPLTWWSCCSC